MCVSQDSILYTGISIHESLKKNYQNVEEK